MKNRRKPTTGAFEGHRWTRGLVLPALAVGSASVALGGCDRQPVSTIRNAAAAGGPSSRATPSATSGPAATHWFVECAAERGLVFHHHSGHRHRHFIPESACGGAALFDMDGDGDLDAYFVQAGPIDTPPHGGPNRLFRNRGEGWFEDVSVGSGAQDGGYGMGVTAGDYDADGDVDLYVTNYGPNTLLENDGTGRFRDVSARAGVGHAGLGSCSAFLDYDADGDLDLFVGNYLRWSPGEELDCRSESGEPEYCSPSGYDAPAPNVLYRNEGDGTFLDVTAEAGLSSAFGTALGVVCGDFTGDGLIDVFVANDGMADQLWVNGGDGRFSERAMLLGCAIDQDGRAKAGMGVCAADVDDDGDEDLLVVNLANESDSFFRNEGGYFADDTALTGLAATSRPYTRFGLGLVDFDHDGYLDVLQATGRVARGSPRHGDDPYAEPNVLLRGGSDGRFREVEPRGGTDPPLAATGRAAAFGDVDGDGAVNALIVNRDGPAHLLLNASATSGHWIMFSVLDRSGRHALHATVELDLGERRVHRTVRRTYSYFAANDPRVHVGLGAARVAGRVVVRWPDGVREAFGDHEADRAHVLRRGTGSSVNMDVQAQEKGVPSTPLSP